MRRGPGSAFIPIAAGLACNDPGSPVPAPDVQSDAAFQTDSTRYTLTDTDIGYTGTIGFVFTNPTDEPVYFVNCRGATSLVLEKWVGDRWTGAWSPAIPLCLSAPIVVAAGSTYRGTVSVLHCSFSRDCLPRFEVADIPGQYRIVWLDVLRSYDEDRYPFGDPLPAEQRTSNTFWIGTETR